MAKKLNHKKLVRDKIPDKIMAQGKPLKVSIANDMSYASKLVEEAQEVEQAYVKFSHLVDIEPITDEDFQPVIEELADLMEITFAFMKRMNISSEEVKKAMAEKKSKNGGFKKGYFLEWVEEE